MLSLLYTAANCCELFQRHLTKQTNGTNKRRLVWKIEKIKIIQVRKLRLEMVIKVACMLPNVSELFLLGRLHADKCY